MVFYPMPARRLALLDHNTTLLVEAGAGSGKTALMAGRVALLLAAGIPTREIVAITFTEAAASELRERIEGFVNRLARGHIPDELRVALPDGLSAGQSAAIAAADKTFDELTCTTIHVFCQQLVKPHPVEAGIDPGATIIDPEAADLAYQDLVQAWLSARFGRDRGAEGLGRLPPLPALGEQDFFAELLAEEPDRVIKRIQETAAFLRRTRTATALCALIAWRAASTRWIAGRLTLGRRRSAVAVQWRSKVNSMPSSPIRPTTTRSRIPT